MKTVPALKISKRLIEYLSSERLFTLCTLDLNTNRVGIAKRKHKMVTAYCVKCKKKREMKNPKQVKLKNGRPAVSGTCPVCGTKMFRIGSMS